MKNKEIAAKMLKLLTKKVAAENKLRNRIIFIAIILTTLLMTVVFTIAFSLKDFFQQQSLKEIGTCAEASYKNITMEEYEKISRSEVFKDISYNIYIGVGEEKLFSNHIVEFRYTDAKAAEWNYCELSAGHFPSEKNEIVIDDLFTQFIGKEYQIGDTVPLKIEINQEVQEYEFTISGTYSGNHVLGVSVVYVSENFAEEIMGALEESNNVEYRNVDAFCRLGGTDGAYECLLDVWKDSGLSGTPSIGINWVLDENGIGLAGLALIGAIIFIIIVAGYLMIYNIFYISIINDMQFYGRLKLLGAQNWQIRKIIIRQVVTLCLLGLPVGLLVGWGIGTKSLPIILKLLNITVSNINTFYPLIFICSLFFVVLTVMISVQKPLKLLKKIQPINTVHYLGGTKAKVVKKQKGSFSISQFAFRNVCRNKRKSMILVASLTLVMILFVLSSNLVHSVDFEQFFKNAIPNDIYISSREFFDGGEAESLDDDFVATCCSLKGVNNSSKYYIRTSLHMLSENAKCELEDAYHSNVFVKDEINGYLEELIYTSFAASSEIRYYFEENALEKLEVVEGEIDYTKLVQDDYVLVCDRIGGTDGIHIYHAGDKITLYDWNDNTSATRRSDGSIEYHNLDKKEYTIMAVVEAQGAIMNYNNGYILNTILPAERAKEDENALLYSVGIDTDHIKDTVQRIAQISNDQEIAYITLDEKKQEYKNLKTVFILMSGGVTVVIAIMSIINFLNQCMTGIIERKKELGTLHAIGMTHRQIVKMIELENGYLLLFSLAIGYILGTGISAVVFHNLQPYLKWLVYRNAIWPAILLIVVLCISIKCFTGRIYHSLKITK